MMNTKRFKQWWNEEYGSAGLLRLVVGSLAAFFILAYLAAVTVSRIDYGYIVAEHEQLRAEMAKRSPIESEALIGKAVESNLRIRANQQTNAQWWGDLVIPDGYDTVTFIDTAPNE